MTSEEYEKALNDRDARIRVLIMELSVKMDEIKMLKAKLDAEVFVTAVFEKEVNRLSTTIACEIKENYTLGTIISGYEICEPVSEPIIRTETQQL